MLGTIFCSFLNTKLQKILHTSLSRLPVTVIFAKKRYAVQLLVIIYYELHLKNFPLSVYYLFFRV
jgi:hypothetical protein